MSDRNSGYGRGATETIAGTGTADVLTSVGGTGGSSGFSSYLSVRDG